MSKKKWDKEVLIISLFLLILCAATYFRVDKYYDQMLEGTKLQTPRFK